MMVEHLQRALQHIDELTPAEQEDVADQILTFAGHVEPRGARAMRLIGAWADMQPDDLDETVLQWRHEVPPTPVTDNLLGEDEDITE
jgi:hypothetical protein